MLKGFEFMPHDKMNKEELWSEIMVLVSATNFTETDKELFLEVINLWGKKK